MVADRGTDDAAGLPYGLPSHLRPVEVVGRGGDAVVWRARDRRAGRDVAVKVLRLTDDAGRERFGSETRALARLAGHPHVLDVLSVGIEDRCAWLVTPFAERSLWDAVGSDGPLDGAALASLAEALASGLASAHSMGVVHGDVTPANVLFVEGAAVLADFGLSSLEAPLSVSRSVGATPGWAAPERMDGSAPTASSDVYGLGATLWSAATALRPPNHRAPDHTMSPRGLDVIIEACCRTDPHRRPTADYVVELAESERRRRDRYCPGP